MTNSVDDYLVDGCGRCELGGTQDCKVKGWLPELRMLIETAVDCGLTEESKWGVPCYTYEQKNVLTISALRDCCAVSFFKGALLNNEAGLLEKPGPNTQAARLIRFTTIQQIREHLDEVKRLMFEAIEVERAGLDVPRLTNPEPLPPELEQRFTMDPTLQAAFEALTPGRQRGYVLYFSAPKKAITREKRIEQCAAKILNGEGLHDEYRRKSKNR